MIFRHIIVQFKAHPVTTTLIILGLALSVLLISVGVSSIQEVNMIVQEELNFAPQHVTMIQYQFAGETNFQDFFATLNGISEGTGVILEQIYVEYADRLIHLQPEYWTDQVVQRFPLVRGRYLNEQDIRNGAKVALVGKERLDDLVIMDGESYILLEDQPYQVVGVIGIPDKHTEAIDSKIVIPATALPKNIVSKLMSKQILQILIHNELHDTYPDEKIIKENTKQLLADTYVTAQPLSSREVIPRPRIGNQFSLSILVYLLALINAINLTAYWINERRYEIGIKKAFGYSNQDIIGMLFQEMCIISFCAVMLGYAMQFIMGNLLQVWIVYPIHLSGTSIFIATLFVSFSAVITTMIPAFKAVRIQPIEAMKR